jgi:hypothetical protein
MADQADLASELEQRERDWLIGHRPAPSVHDGLCAVCCVCGGPTALDRETCASCADRATEGA